MTEPSILLVKEPVVLTAVGAFATARGLALAWDPPWTDGLRQAAWSGDAGQISFVSHAASGCGLFVVAEPEDGADLFDAVKARFEGLVPEEVVAEARAADTAPQRIRAMFAVSALLLPVHHEADLELAFLCEQLHDERRPVRWAAARILRGRPLRGVHEAMGEAARTYSELLPLAAHLGQLCDAAEAGTLNDHPTDDGWVLVERARDGLRDGQIERVRRATDMLLDDRLDHGEGLLLRSYLHAHDGEHAVALGLAGAAETVLRDEWVEDDDESHVDALAQEATDQRQALEDGWAAADDDAEAVMAWLTRFRDGDCPAAEAGMACALKERMPSLAPLLAYLWGRYALEVDTLTRVAEDAPDSPDVQWSLGRAWRDEDGARAEAALRRALELLANDTRSPAAAMIERYPAPGADEASVLGLLTPLVYQRQAWEEAGQLADALVEVDPESAIGWQIRANARTFALKHAEAAKLYREALTALDAIFGDPDGIVFGEDPRPGMHFNLSCVLAKVGDREASLHHLRHAVRAEAHWAEQAVEDDYYGPLLEDATFKRIVAQEPRALVFSEELERSFIDDLCNQALGRGHMGEVDAALELSARAAQLAGWGDHPDLEVLAMTVRGRLLALERDPGAGLEVLQRAVGRLEDDRIDEETGSGTRHAYGLALQVNGKLEEAEAAFAEALAARRRVYGEGHPLLAKSLGDMAHLALQRDDRARAKTLTGEGIALLDAFLGGEEPEEPERVEALTDRATLRANLARLAAQEDAWEEALAQTTGVFEALEPLKQMGYRHEASFLDNVADLASALVRTAPSDDGARAARSLQERLGAMDLDPHPEVAQEQLFWRKLRRFVARLRREGVSDAQLAETFADALRGADKLPKPLQSVPELGGFAHALAQRAANHPTFLVLAPMALETARSAGDLDGALEQLEGLCVSFVAEGAYPENGPEDGTED